jgi:hypothetical protein
MNDYTVIRLGDKPVPQKPPLPKYPKTERTNIEPDIPGVFWAIKRHLQPEPEYKPPKRQKSRKINTACLSEYQKQMKGKTAFEQDLVIIARKHELFQGGKSRRQMIEEGLAEDERLVDHIKFPFVQRKPQRRRESARGAVSQESGYPSEAQPSQGEDWQWHNNDDLVDRQRKYRHVMLKRQLEESRKRKQEARQKALEEQARAEAEEALQRIMKEQGTGEESGSESRGGPQPITFDPTKPTRSTSLKAETSRRWIEHRNVEERRELLNLELRREKEEKETKRLQGVLLRLRPLDKSKGTADQQKQKMREHEKQWKKQCILTDQKLDMTMPMLERLFADDHLTDLGKPSGPDPAAP